MGVPARDFAAGSHASRLPAYENIDQGLLLPPSLRGWLPEDHLVWFITETVDELDPDAFL